MSVLVVLFWSRDVRTLRTLVRLCVVMPAGMHTVMLAMSWVSGSLGAVRARSKTSHPISISILPFSLRLLLLCSFRGGPSSHFRARAAAFGMDTMCASWGLA